MDVLKLVADAKDSVIAAKDREIALTLEARAASERALQLELRTARRVAARRQQEAEQQRQENEQLKSAHARELEALRSSLGSVHSAVERALREERARLAAQAAAARYSQEQRALWLRSPDCVLRVLCAVAYSGHPARSIGSLSRAFRGDAQLWGCIKDRCGRNGWTYLMASSRSGDLARVRWLLERGANANAGRASDGMTALMWACARGHLEVVRELLARGAQPNAARAGDGWTALMAASEKGHVRIVRALLAQGADVHAAQSDDGVTPLLWACQKGHLEVAKELLGRGASANAARTDDGWTPLMAACEGGHTEVARALLGRGAEANAARGSDGTTALMWACQSGQTGAARLLLEHQASKAAVCSSGRTALDYTPAELAELRELVKP